MERQASIAMYDYFCKLFATVKATEKLEKACVRAHFKTLSSLFKQSFEQHFVDTYIADGLPFTPSLHRGSSGYFVTSMDSFTLNMVAVNEVHHPLLSASPQEAVIGV